MRPWRAVTTDGMGPRESPAGPVTGRFGCCPRIVGAAVPGGSQPAVALVVVFVKDLPDIAD
jgi:hypothetical protein